MLTRLSYFILLVVLALAVSPLFFGVWVDAIGAIRDMVEVF